MNAHLLRHALQTVWCNPGQDRQFIYRLAKLSDKYGTRNTLALRYDRIPLPTQGETYQVYQIGQVLPSRVGLPHTTRRWLSLAELANDHLLVTDLYTNAGLQFPRFQSYIWITPSRNVLIAVRPAIRIADLATTPLYLRFYSNAYFQSQRSEEDRHLYVQGRVVGNTDELLAFQRDLSDGIANFDGEVFHYVNGRLTGSIGLTTAMAGDVVEAVFDSSVKKVVDLPVTDLLSFESTRDQMRKYLLHYAGTSDVIDYVDDLDVYLFTRKSGNRLMGVYYHHNEVNWLRMVTHKDYSLPVRRIASFVEDHPVDLRHDLNPDRFDTDNWESPEALTVRVYIRHSGYDRPLEPNAQRIQQLYRLDDERIQGVMTATQADVPIWHAAALENSPYIRFMSLSPDAVYPVTYNRPEDNSEAKQDLQDHVGDVYGYHAAAKLLADSPLPTYTQDGYRYADLHYNHWHNATVFEYDEDGALLAWYHHVEGMYYLVRQNAGTTVEVIKGTPGPRLATTFGSAPVTVPVGWNARLYVRPMFGGEPDGEWRDITQANDRDNFGLWDGDTWEWIIDDLEWEGAVRTDERLLVYDLDLVKSAGYLRFSVNALEDHGDGENERILEIPFGQLDVWLNGRALVENLDYTVKWPEVVIHNREYLLDDDDVQKVTVRGYSFCRSDLTRLPVTEHGFVEYGVLSNDDTFSVHAHKVQRLVVNGHLYDTDAVVWDEARGEATFAGERNGVPYQLQTPPVVFPDVYDDDQAARQADDAREKQVVDYLTENNPPRERENPDFIPKRYEVVSVFANKLLQVLLDGRLYPEGIEGHYGETEIRRWCDEYEWLLEHDIANSEYDQAHVIVHPHWFTTVQKLTLYQYSFYVRALKTYLRYPPDVAAFVKIKEPHNGE